MLQGFSLKQRAEKKEDVEQMVDILMQVWEKRSAKVNSSLNKKK